MLEDAFKFYYKATKLKDMLRQGAVQWEVKKERIESIAEHTFGCMTLAIALQSELNLKLDLGKTLEMITIHELEELAIGDVTPLDNIDKKTLRNKARVAVYNFVKDMSQKDRLMALTDEFNEGLSEEARFAKAIDKLECVLEFKKYQDNGHVSLKHLKPEMLKNKKLKEYVDSGQYDLADIFFLFHKHAFESYGIDEEYWYKVLKPLEIHENMNLIER